MPRTHLDTARTPPAWHHAPRWARPVPRSPAHHGPGLTCTCPLRAAPRKALCRGCRAPCPLCRMPCALCPVPRLPFAAGSGAALCTGTGRTGWVLKVYIYIYIYIPGPQGMGQRGGREGASRSEEAGWGAKEAASECPGPWGAEDAATVRQPRASCTRWPERRVAHARGVQPDHGPRHRDAIKHLQFRIHIFHAVGNRTMARPAVYTGSTQARDCRSLAALECNRGWQPGHGPVRLGLATRTMPWLVGSCCSTLLQ